MKMFKAIEKGKVKTYNYQNGMKTNEITFCYWLKMNKGCSEYGIAGGRIEELVIEQGGEIVTHYDKGWIIKPTDPERYAAFAMVMDKRR